jgi:predicted nucleotidyltransferase
VRQVEDIQSLVRSKRTEILRITAANGATRVRVFGSVAHGSAKADSDLDLLIDLEPGRDLLDLVAIKLDLEDLLGRRVHLVTEAALSPYIRDAVLHDATSL